ncbi:MAG: hypothetical protein QXN59_02520, partial [Candidatus Micrarchaeaceae archaeon]
EVLMIDRQKSISDISLAFSQAIALSRKAGIINMYTIVDVLSKAFNDALYLATEAGIPTKETIARLLGKAAANASALENAISK